ncbi:hypothetical protein Q3G72_025057 [Acer saccharum]|nr:hypothetical protein Q3G72_025057 [Acer saccharum]
MTTEHDKLNRENTDMESASISHYLEDLLEGKVNQLLVALSTTQKITKHNKLNRENTGMERASISHHVKDLEDKINQLLVPLSITQMITNHFKLNREITDMERASISHLIKDLQGKINQVLVPLSTTRMIAKHFKLNRENTDIESDSSSHPVEDLEGKINQLLEALSATQLITENYKVDLEEKEEEEMERLPLLPVHHAAFWGRKETVRYLLSVTDWTENNNLDSRALLLMRLIQSNLHGMALEVLKHYPKLALPDKNKYWNDIPLKDDHVAWPNVDSEDADEEKQNPKCSTNCSEEFPTHPQIASTIVYLAFLFSPAARSGSVTPSPSSSKA